VGHRAGLNGCGKSRHTGIRFPDLPAAIPTTQNPKCGYGILEMSQDEPNLMKLKSENERKGSNSYSVNNKVQATRQ
jgi:hypothetical protein